jgi:hypothetical protein
MYPLTSFWGGSEESIKKSFKKKAKRYGILDKPYIICINAIGIRGNGEFDINNALWGSLAFTWSTNPVNRNERLERKRDGIFLSEKGPSYQNVSGDLITKFMEFNIADTEYYFAKHPYSNVESNFNAFDLTYYYNDNGQIVSNPGRSFSEILGVKKNWLEGYEAFRKTLITGSIREEVLFTLNKSFLLLKIQKSRTWYNMNFSLSVPNNLDK